MNENMWKNKKCVFVADGEEFDIKNVPDNALAILKNQTQNNILAVNQTKKKINKIFIASTAIVFLGVASFTASVFAPDEAFYALQSITITSGVASTIGDIVFLKKQKKLNLKEKIFKQIDQLLSEEIKERKTLKEAFPEFYDEKLTNKVKHALLDIEYEI